MQRLSATIFRVGTTAGEALAFWCPACNGWHTAPVSGSSAIEWNGDAQAPSLAGSVRFAHAGGTCHFELRDGNITYLADSTHGLAGHTAPLPPAPDPPAGA